MSSFNAVLAIVPNLPSLSFGGWERSKQVNMPFFPTFPGFPTFSPACAYVGARVRARVYARERFLNSRLGRLGRLGRSRQDKAFQAPNLLPTFPTFAMEAV